MKSPKGYTLSNAIMTGVVTPHLGVGCTAGDEDCWTIFKDLYYPIIKEWHGYDPETQVCTNLTTSIVDVVCITLVLSWALPKSVQFNFL